LMMRLNSSTTLPNSPAKPISSLKANKADRQIRQAIIYLA
jgi:hypothetical protein